MGASHVRRRALALGLLGALALAACTPAPAPGQRPATGSASSQPARPIPSPTPAPACRSAAAALTVQQQALQVLVSAVDPALVAPDAETLRHLAAGLGGVLYLPSTRAPLAQVATLSAALGDAATIDPLVTIDQEGGQVVRLTGDGFSQMPSANVQASWPVTELGSRARAWGRELAAAGIDVDLAPVADVVPEGEVAGNAPVGQLERGYGSDPTEVSARVAAFAQGMTSGGTGVALKHYPGLGRTAQNTDFDAAHDTVTTLDDPALAPFRDNAAAAAMVMVATVVYERIDPEQPAAFSPAVMAAIRDDLRFDGPIVSDDLGVAAAVAHLAPAERAVRFVRAGGDTIITVDPALVDEMAAALVAAAGTDPSFAARLADAARRVLVLKDARGVHLCG